MMKLQAALAFLVASSGLAAQEHADHAAEDAPAPHAHAAAESTAATTPAAEGQEHHAAEDAAAPHAHAAAESTGATTPAADGPEHAGQSGAVHEHAADPGHTGAGVSVAPGAAAPPDDAAASADSAAMAAARHMNLMMHGGTFNYLVIGERFERRDDGDDSLVWEMQGWAGTDYHKLWLKTEGSRSGRRDENGRGEVQALYSRAIAPYWDLQMGLRHDGLEGPARSHAVLGVMGLAPYWFEVDAAAFLSERGDLGARLEAEYELRFTQRLFLQPRLELNYSFADDPAIGLGQGMSEANAGLRLRYEWRREFAPYVGVEWHRAYGATAGLLRRAGAAREDLEVVAGIRFWY